MLAANARRSNLLSLAACGAALVIGLLLSEVLLQVSWVTRVLRIHADTNMPVAQGISELRRKGLIVYPFALEVTGYRPVSLPSRHLNVVPVAGIGNVLTYLCNETGSYVTYTADRFGFANPDSVWNERAADAALVGDSFTHGQCVGPQRDIASHMRNKFVVLNTGVAGAGPLAELAVLREYAAIKRPATVVWLFYEGNDMENLSNENHNSVLVMYLEPSFTQHLASMQESLDAELRNTSDSAFRAHREHESLRKTADLLLLKHVRSALHLRFRKPPPTPAPDFDLLDRVLSTADHEVRAWGGKLLFVYLPERRRYDPSVTAVMGEDHDISGIRVGAINAAKALSIPVIDMTNAFSAAKEPLQYWTGIRSHYTSGAYAIIADSITSRILEEHRFSLKSN